MMASSAHILVVLAVLCSCTATRTVFEVSQNYSPPELKDFETSRQFDVGDFDKVWEEIIRFFASNQLPIETLEKVSGIVVARKVIGDSAANPWIAPGVVSTTVQKVTETLSPTQFAGSANPDIVRRTGKVTKRTVDPESVATFEMAASYRVTLSFNVFAERFQANQLKVTINASFEPAENLKLYSGWFWPDYFTPPLDTSSPQAILAGFIAAVPTAFAQKAPAPMSTGVFESAFLDRISTKRKAP